MSKTKKKKKTTSEPLTFTKSLSYDNSVLENTYHSRIECYNDAEAIIKQLHSDANAYFDPCDKKSLSKECAKHYSNIIISKYGKLLPELEKICKANNLIELCNKIDKLINESKNNLKKTYDEELVEDAEFYEMYNIDYFMEMIEIDENENNICKDDNPLGHLVNVCLSKAPEYRITDIHSSINEMENDLTDHATTFYKYAHRVYSRYVERIESVLDMINYAD
ncbi:MAG: hypothetical protein E7271_06475 [Lachnospiraceae bacterium]|jgi:hypothetical protein|nr:hypothetical protein [Lachnospiraceae bacterium]